MKVRCDAHNICKGKHISYENGCPHFIFHESKVSDCCGYCGTVGKIVMCDEPTRKEKLENLQKISNDKRYKNRR